MKGSKVKQTEKLLNEVMQTDMSLIQDTLNDMDSTTFSLAIDTIMQSRQIYILGVRNSAPLAQFLAFYLTPIFPCVRLVHTNSASEIYEQMLHIGPKDVVIGISFPRYSMRVLKALEFANSRSAKVITITDTDFSPINLYSSCKLLAKSNMCSVVDTLTPAFSLVNALIVSICMKKKKSVLKSLEELNRVWDEYPVDNHDEINSLAEDVFMEKESFN